MTASTTIDLTQPTQALRDQIVAVADLLTSFGATLMQSADELYRAAAPDTDVADEEAVTERTVQRLAREVPEHISRHVLAWNDEGVNAGVADICDAAHSEDGCCNDDQ